RLIIVSILNTLVPPTSVGDRIKVVAGGIKKKRQITGRKLSGGIDRVSQLLGEI
ncbi:Hypothetical predicted protein, partial [Olea europaea subsp. europaea]